MIIIYYVASALRVYIIIIYKSVLYNYYHQVHRIGALAIRGHSWTGRRWWKSLNPAYLSRRYGNDSLRERIYIIYYIPLPPPPRTDGSSASIDYPHGGRARLENRPGLNAGSAREGELFAGTSGAASRTPNESSLTPAARACIQRIILYNFKSHF